MVNIAYSGSASDGSDFTGVTDGTVTIAAGSDTATITITVLDVR